MAKKRSIVVARSQSAQINGLKTSKGLLDFKGKSAKWVDESLASEIDTEHGLKGSGEVWVDRDENLEWHMSHDGDTDGRNHSKGGHRYFFGTSTSKAWDDFWKRYNRKKKK